MGFTIADKHLDQRLWVNVRSEALPRGVFWQWLSLGQRHCRQQKCVSKTHILQTRGQLQLRATTPPPF